MASNESVTVATTNPVTTAVSTTTTTTTTNPVSSPSSSSASSIENTEATQRVTKIENQRKLCYTVGCVQLTWGIIGMFLAFSWVSNILTLATGALSVGAWYTLNDALRYFDRNQPNCCNPSHTKPLCISIIVFTILELITFGAVFPIGIFFIAIANASATDADGNTYTVPTGPRAYITYIGLSLVLGVVWPVISLILSIIQMCFTDSLMSLGQSRIYVNPSSAQITVISMQPVMPQQGMMPHPGGGYATSTATPNIYQMAQYASQVPQPPNYGGGGYMVHPHQLPPPGMHTYPPMQQGYPNMNYPYHNGPGMMPQQPNVEVPPPVTMYSSGNGGEGGGDPTVNPYGKN